MFAGFVEVDATSLLMEDSVQQSRLFPFISFLDLIKTQFFQSAGVRTRGLCYQKQKNINAESHHHHHQLFISANRLLTFA